MLTLSKTENCSYIEIKSEVLSDFISNPDNYTNFVISGSLNCCSNETTTIELEQEQFDTFQWSADFPTNLLSNLRGIFFENVFTGVTFNVLSATYPVGVFSCSSGDITDLFPIVQSWFTANLGVTITQSYTYNSTTGECTYIISGLPQSIRPINIQVRTSGIDVYNDFTYAPVQNMFFAGNALMIEPSFFTMLNFQDGVYSFDITYTTSDNNIIQEKNCFFLDCNTACTVSTKLQELEKVKDEKNATNIFLLHYTLTEGSNCGCNCDELCEIFTKLCKTLNSSSCLCGCV